MFHPKCRCGRRCRGTRAKSTCSATKRGANTVTGKEPRPGAMAPAGWTPADSPPGAPLELTSRLVHGLDAAPGNPGTLRVAPAVPGATRSARPIALRLDGSTTLRHTAAA